ncbi:MAG TPA: HNH endonuclease [Methylomirabilota bacterium]|nr:HNH endonuclease [Methylomirabilota bacterium]
MCRVEAASLQRGMNFRLGGKKSVILMNRRRGAPYADKVEEDGRVLIYEGHDVPRTSDGPSPKLKDQVASLASGKLTQNGLFLRAVADYKSEKGPAEAVRVYEKIREGIWAFAGEFLLIDAWQETASGRAVFKFKLMVNFDEANWPQNAPADLATGRLIPTAVKLEVWARDRGRCVKCGSRDNLHFDHVIPYSKGGSSLVAENIQLLCARHNLSKRDHIE